MGRLEDEIRKLQLAEEASRAAALSEAVRRTTAAQQEAAETQARIAREQSAELAERTQFAQAVRDRLDAALKLLEPEKVLKEVQQLWGTGMIDSKPTYRPDDLTDLFSYEFPPSASLGLRYSFPLLREKIKVVNGQPRYSQYSDEGRGPEFLGYEKIEKHAGWKLEAEELALQIGVSLPFLGHP